MDFTNYIQEIETDINYLLSNPEENINIVQDLCLGFSKLKEVIIGNNDKKCCICLAKELGEYDLVFWIYFNGNVWFDLINRNSHKYPKSGERVNRYFHFQIRNRIALLEAMTILLESKRLNNLLKGNPL